MAANALGIVYFTVPGDSDLHFARRFGHDYYGMNRWRGWRLCGVHNKRAGAALVRWIGRSGDPGAAGNTMSHLCDCGAPDCPICGPIRDSWREQPELLPDDDAEMPW